jgi:hypothetical protein
MILVSALVAAFGAQYTNEGQGMQSMMDQFLVPSVTEQEWCGGCNVTENTQEKKNSVTLSSVLQPWQKGASPTGDLTIAPLTMTLSKMKYETDIDPDTIERTYAGWLRGVDTNDRSQWTITKWIAEIKLVEKGREDWELKAIMGGEYAAPTPGTGGAPETSHDGILTQVADAITATTITAINGPAAWSTDSEDCANEFEAWLESVRGTSETIRTIIDNHCDKVFMSKTLAMRIRKGLDIKYKDYGSQVAISGAIKTAAYRYTLPYHNLEVVGLPSMTGSSRVILTPPQNRDGYIKAPNSEQVAQLYPTGPRELLAFCDFYKQVSYWDPQYMYVNQLA